MDSIIKLQKDKLGKDNNTNLVYLTGCNDCDKKYVGQTKRLLNSRRREHEDNIKKDESLHNIVTKHLLENCEHSIDWENFKILHKESHWKKICIFVSAFSSVSTYCLYLEAES